MIPPSPYLAGRLQAHTPLTEAVGLPEGREERLEWYRGRREEQSVRRALRASVAQHWPK